MHNILTIFRHQKTESLREKIRGVTILCVGSVFIRTKGLFLIAQVLCALVISADRVYADRWGTAEARLRSAFLVNFLRFTRFPPPLDEASYFLCILGVSKFGEVENELSSQTINDHKIVVIHLGEAPSRRTCHILWVNAGEEEKYKDYLDSISDLPILVIGEGDAIFNFHGGISLYWDRQRLRFHVNLESITTRNLKMSSQVLRLARKIIK